MNKLGRIMEHFWLALAIATLLAAVWVIVNEGWDKGAQWLVLPAIATAAWLMRRFVRRRLDSVQRRD